MAAKRISYVMASLVLVGCSAPPADENPESGTETQDAGVPAFDADTTTDVPPDAASPDAMPLGPAEAALPVLTPCADGWVEAVQDGITICKPWQGFDGPLCSGGLMRAPGEAVCKLPGTSCPTGQWPEGLPTSGVFYVDPLASGAQQGTIDRPFATISQALTRANPGDTVALAKGVHEGSFMVVDKDVNIVGACVEQTSISLGHTGEFILPSDYCELLFDHQAGHLTLRDLQVKDSFVGIRGNAGASLSLQGASMSHLVTAIEGTFDSIDVDDSYIRSQRSYLFESCILATIALPEGDTVANAGPLNCPVFTDPIPQFCPSHVPAPPAIFYSTSSGSAAPTGLSVRNTVVVTGIAEANEPGATLAPVSIQDSYFQKAALRGPVDITRSVCSAELTTTGSVNASDSDCNLLLQGAGGEVHRHQGSVSMLCPSSGAQLVGSDIVKDSVNFNSDQLFFSGPCVAELDRVAVDGSRIGIAAHEGAQVQLRDLVVRDVIGLGSAPDWSRLPVSIGVYTGGEMSVERFLLSGSPVAGAQLGPEGALLSLSNGHIANNLIGVNVQAPDYDLDLLQNLVTWENNTLDIDAQDLQDPAPIAEFECGDLGDNDGDNKVDCEDPDCAFSPDCP